MGLNGNGSCLHSVVIRLSSFVGVTSTLNSFYATKRQPFLFLSEKCGLRLQRLTTLQFANTSRPWVSPCSRLEKNLGMTTCKGGGRVSRKGVPGSRETKSL